MIIIQLLKDTKYPANYQIIIDSLLGNYAVLRDFFSALHEGHGRPRSVRKSSRLRWKCLSMDCICPQDCCCSDRRKSLGPSAPIAYATSVLLRMRLPPGRVRSSCKSPRIRIPLSPPLEHKNADFMRRFNVRFYYLV